MLNANTYFSLGVLSLGFSHNLVVQKLATEACYLIDSIINCIDRAVTVCAGRMLFPIAADKNYCRMGSLSRFESALQRSQLVGVLLFFGKLLFVEALLFDFLQSGFLILSLGSSLHRH